MLYSKNGSIPKPETDGTEGWIEVGDPPSVQHGLEVVWWYPPGWVVRTPQPPDTEATVWKWSQTSGEWIEYPRQAPEDTIVEVTGEQSYGQTGAATEETA